MIGELHKNGWKPKASANDCEKCRKKVSEYFDQSYFPESFACEPTDLESTDVFNININIKSINKVSRTARFLLGTLAGRAELDIEVIASVNGKNRKILFVKSAINANAIEAKSFFDLRSADTGNTEQAVYEAAVQIANLLEDSLKSMIAHNVYSGEIYGGVR